MLQRRFPDGKRFGNGSLKQNQWVKEGANKSPNAKNAYVSD